MGKNANKMRNNSNKIGRGELKEGDHIYSWRMAHTYAHHGIYAGEGKVIHFTGLDKEAGNENLISRSSFSSKTACQCGHRSHASGVIISCIDCFLSGGSLSRFRYGVSKDFFLSKKRGGTCTFANSDPTVDVMHRARYLLKMNGFGPYNLFKNNCENFAVYCKTGLVVADDHCVGHSGQIGNLIAGAMSIKNPTARLIATSMAIGVSCAIAGPKGAMHILKGFQHCTGGTSDTDATYNDRRIASDIGKRSDVKIISVERLVTELSSNKPDAAVECPVTKSDIGKRSNVKKISVERLVAELGSNEPNAAVECLVTESDTDMVTELWVGRSAFFFIFIFFFFFFFTLGISLL